MSWPQISYEECKNLGRITDSEIVYARSLSKLNKKLKKWGNKYCTLCHPKWIGGYLVVVIIKPREE